MRDIEFKVQEDDVRDWFQNGYTGIQKKERDNFTMRYTQV